MGFPLGVLGGLNNTLTRLEYRSSLGALASCVLVHIHDRGSLNTGKPRGKCFCDRRLFLRIRLRIGDEPNATAGFDLSVEGSKMLLGDPPDNFCPLSFAG